MTDCTIHWNEPTEVLVRLPFAELRVFHGPLAACVGFVLELAGAPFDHEAMIESQVLGPISLDEARRLAERRDYPAVFPRTL